MVRKAFSDFMNGYSAMTGVELFLNFLRDVNLHGSIVYTTVPKSTELSMSFVTDGVSAGTTAPLGASSPCADRPSARARAALLVSSFCLAAVSSL